jgi:S1-C subfamily serine protease
LRRIVALGAAVMMTAAGLWATAVSAPTTRPRGGVAQVIDRVMPAVVRVYGRRSSAFRGVGAGVILSADGVIVTHIGNVVGVEEPMVLLSDGRRLPATVVGTDSETELAVLRVSAAGLPTLRFADSAKVRPGQWVLAIGNPFDVAREADEELSANLGVITAYSQVRAAGFKYQGFVFLTDAQINPGSYGGALVDLNGLLVALNGRVVTSQDTNTQMAVAIPVNDVLPAVVRVLKNPATAPATAATRPATTRPAA